MTTHHFDVEKSRRIARQNAINRYWLADRQQAHRSANRLFVTTVLCFVGFVALVVLLAL